jgi:hypothetical protein
MAHGLISTGDHPLSTPYYQSQIPYHIEGTTAEALPHRDRGHTEVARHVNQTIKNGDRQTGLNKIFIIEWKRAKFPYALK